MVLVNLDNISVFRFMKVIDLFVTLCRKQVSGGRAEADKDGVVIPTTLEEYCIKTQVKKPEAPVDMTDFYVDDYDLDDDDDDLEMSGDEYDDGDDSGNGES